MNPNDPAFPGPWDRDVHGLTKREWLAGLALNATIQRIQKAEDMVEAPRAAIAMADLLIRLLNEETK